MSVFSAHSRHRHHSAPMLSVFDMTRLRISRRDICPGTKLRPNSGRNKYANHSDCQNRIVIQRRKIYAFQVGLSHISVFLPFPSHACHVWRSAEPTTVVVARRKAS